MILNVILVAGLGLASGGLVSRDAVDSAIENVGWHYSDKLCLDLLMVDCSKHHTVHDEQICGSDYVTYDNQKYCTIELSPLDLLMVDCSKHHTVHDEQICGSDYVTYDNHCKYVHAYCQFVYSPTHLSILNHGPCPITTAPPATSASPAGSTQIVTGSTQPPVGSTQPPAGVSTTVAGPATTNANHQIIQNVFCMNADGISCAASGVDVICGTNGVLYPNQCEFAKAHCKIPSLSHDDPANCASPGK